MCDLPQETNPSQDRGVGKNLENPTSKSLVWKKGE